MNLTKIITQISVACLAYATIGYSQNAELTQDQILLQNIGTPWGFTFLSSNEVIFTEKGGKLFRYNISTNTRTEITGLPSINQNGQGGLLDVAIHPNFSQNSFVYLTYAVSANNGQTTALGRGKLVNNQLQNFTEIFRAMPIVNSGQHFGSRIAFDRNNRLYMSVGDRGTPDNAQNLNNHAGKIMRLNDDGTVPTDNPFVGRQNHRPEIFSYGHRNIQGMAMNPATGEIYAHEHGPRGGDELNLIKKGANYGWPTITFGINYDGSTITPDTAKAGMEQPLTYWVPSIAPSGLAFIDKGLPSNEAEVLIGALAGTHVHWLRLKDNKKQWATRSLQGYARFRDIRQAPDGKVYALTESPNRFVRLKSNVTITSIVEETAFQTEEYVHPNPGSEGGTLTFYLPYSQSISIKIYSLDGNAVYEKNLMYSQGSHQLPFEVASAPKGMYHIEIIKENSRTLHKWIKM